MDSTTVQLDWSTSPFWSSFWGNLSIELIGGLISALIFLFFVLIFFKPKIKIAPFLCKVDSTPPYYLFKFVNKSLFAAHEISVELHLMKRVPMGQGNFNSEYKKLSIQNGQISHIPKSPLFWQKKNDSHPHCILVRSSDDIDAILNDPLQSIVIKVSLKHGLTGLSEIYEQEYGNTSDVKVSKFKPGTKFETL